MIQDLIRKHLRNFVPYTSARSEVQRGKVFLDANELSYGTPVHVDGIPLNRYPDPNQVELRGKLAEVLAVDSDRVFVGAGSDEIIDLLIRLVCEPGIDRVAVVEPTYGVSRVAAELSGVDVGSVPLDHQFQIDVVKTLASLGTTTKIIFLCSPNNPTGNLLRREDILSLCKNSDSLVVVDQAYLEFADWSGDMMRDVEQYPNLVVLRTLSKAWGLAGIRLGYCVADPMIVSYLLRIKAPYNINAVTSKLAIDALGNRAFLDASREGVKSERVWLERELRLLPSVTRVYPSDANFILVVCVDAARVYRHLADRGIIVRRRSEARLNNCLRITVGTPEENELLLRALKELK